MPLWDSLEEAKEQVLWGLGHCHILKISDNEITWLTGKEDYTEGVEWIGSRYHIPLILVSMGKEGSRAYYKGHIVEAAPFLRADTIETTGAGDTFCGCILAGILEKGINGLTEQDLSEMLTFANAEKDIERCDTDNMASAALPPLRGRSHRFCGSRRAFVTDDCFLSGQDPGFICTAAPIWKEGGARKRCPVVPLPL